MKFSPAAALLTSLTALTTLSAQAQVVGVYVSNERPTAVLEALAPGRVTHVLYAFLRLCGPGQLAADAAACEGKPDFSVAPNDAHERYHEAFTRLKARDARLTVLASMGGWGGSDPFFHLAATQAGRAALVASAQDVLRAHPAFDGIDIDWEHPGNNGAANGVPLGGPQDGERYVALMRELRAGLDALGRETGRRYALTAAVETSAAQVRRQRTGAAAESLDLVFMMTYDYFGSWSPRAGHHTAVRGPHSLATSIATLRAAGVPARKLVAGVAMYGRGFEGVKPDGSYAKPWPSEDGSVAFKDLGTLSGLKPQFDPRTQSWALVGGGRYLGYDDPRTVKAKRDLARKQGLAGVFAWELSQDNGQIVDAMQP